MPSEKLISPMISRFYEDGIFNAGSPYAPIPQQRKHGGFIAMYLCGLWEKSTSAHHKTHMLTLESFNAGTSAPVFFEVEQPSNSAFQEAPVISNGHPLAMRSAEISYTSTKVIEPHPDSPLND